MEFWFRRETLRHSAKRFAPSIRNSNALHWLHARALKKPSTSGKSFHELRRSTGRFERGRHRTFAGTPTSDDFGGLVAKAAILLTHVSKKWAIFSAQSVLAPTSLKSDF
jgi:hypothetical protein